MRHLVNILFRSQGEEKNGAGGGEKCMNRKIPIAVMLFLAMIVLLSTVGLAIAEQPKLTYTMGGLGGFTIDPGEVFVSADKIEHLRNKIGMTYVYGTPWGNGITQKTVNHNMDMSQIPDEISGSGIEHSVDTYDDGTVLEGLITFKVTGIGLYIYEGPTFEFAGVTVQAGDMFGGVLASGTSVKHGVNGNSESIQVRGEWTSVKIFAGPPALIGKGIICETGTYWVTA